MNNLKVVERNLGMSFLRSRRFVGTRQALQLIAGTILGTAAVWGFLKIAFLFVGAYQ
jgi:hypothetical protein